MVGYTLFMVALIEDVGMPHVIWAAHMSPLFDLVYMRPLRGRRAEQCSALIGTPVRSATDLTYRSLLVHRVHPTVYYGIQYSPPYHSRFFR